MLDLSNNQKLNLGFEQDRLDELFELDIVGTPHELRFDCIVRSASLLFQAPMAFLTFIEEDRQWFKAAVGFDAIDMDSSISFCSHTILSDSVMIVPDAETDIRFADNPTVTGEPHIRFYAGAPLITRSGNRLGALCVVDTVARATFTEEQRRSLECLADLAVDQLYLRKEEMKQQAAAAMANGMSMPLLAIGTPGSITFANEAAHHFFGVEQGGLLGESLDSFISSDRLHTDAETLLLAFESPPEFTMLRLTRTAKMPDGSTRPVRMSVSRWQRPPTSGLAVVIEPATGDETSDISGDGKTDKLTGVGYAIADTDSVVPAELISDAGFALHSVNRTGGDGVKLCEPVLRIESLERDLMQVELLRALQNDEFRLHYQPQVCLKSGEVLGFEALIRWQHPQRGLLSPSDFLHDVEEGHYALPIGWWVLNEACGQLARWRADGLPVFRIAVNLFSAQFRSDCMVTQVVAALDRHQIPPQLLELEITETVAFLDNDNGLASLRVLRDMGMGIAFDDFGTGYASLSSLQRFPLTTLKLDRSFTRDMMGNHGDAVIMRSMISMANELKLETVAEGIESPEQAAFLSGLNCSLGQGYLYGKPVAPDQVKSIVKQQRHASMPKARKRAVK